MEAFTGTILSVPFDFAPYGWSTCWGQVVPVNQNQALYSLIGNIYGGQVSQGTFGLPDLRGRGAIGYGSGPGLTAHALGAKGGTESINVAPSHTHGLSGEASLAGASASGSVSLPVSVSLDNVPVAVTGKMTASTEAGSQDVPFEGAVPADVSPGGSPKIYGSVPADPSKVVQMAPIASSGTLSGAATGTASGNVSLPLTGSIAGNLTVQPAGMPAVGVMSPFLALNYIICLQGLYPQRP